MLVAFVRVGEESRGRCDGEEGDVRCGTVEGAGHVGREWELQCLL